jgi:hypothetical protein
VWPRRARALPYKGAGRVTLAARRPARSSRHRALMAGTDGQERHQCPADNALGRSGSADWPVPAVEKMGRRCLAVRWGRAGHEEARADTCADLTHLSSTFGPGMGRPDRFCLFASGRWVAIYPFFCLRGRVRTRGGRLRRPALEMPLPSLILCLLGVWSSSWTSSSQDPGKHF